MYAAAVWCAAAVAPGESGNGMARRFLLRALVPATALALGAIGLTPASAGAATWQLVSVVGDPAGGTQFSDVAASGPDNAWITGVGCTDSSCASQGAIIEQWNGQSWQPFTLPDSSIFGFGTGVVVGTSSVSNTWIFGADVNNVGYGVHVTDSGATQTIMPAANGGLSFTGAAVFSPSDAWAFGVTGDFNNAIFSAYAAHYDGQTWTELPTPPVVPNSISALSSNNLWILGQQSFTSQGTFDIAHWAGSGWLTVPVPDATSLKLPAGVLFQPVSILANSSDDVWVTADLNAPTCPPCGFGGGALLLHWNGNNWHSVHVPSALSIGLFDPDMASDGQGGLWVSGFPVNSANGDLYHFSNGDWSAQPAPTQDGLQAQISSLAWVPRTTSLWGAGALFNSMPDGSVTSQGVIDQFSP
jgi:hypothetical protein